MHSTEPNFKSKCISNITVHINSYITDTCLLKKRAIFYSPSTDFCYIEPFPTPPPDYSHPLPVCSVLESMSLLTTLLLQLSSAEAVSLPTLHFSTQRLPLIFVATAVSSQDAFTCVANVLSSTLASICVAIALKQV